MNNKLINFFSLIVNLSNMCDWIESLYVNGPPCSRWSRIPATVDSTSSHCVLSSHTFLLIFVSAE